MHANDESAASGQPIPTGERGQRDRLRCQLVPVSPPEENWRWRKKVKATPPPPLVLDMGIKDAIRVTDANTNELIASDWLAQVTATSATYKKYGDDNNQGYTQPLLIVGVPGLQPLRIGACPMGSGWGGPQFRYAWRGWVPDEEYPTHVVTEAEWLTLVEKLGSGTRVVDDYASGKIARRDRRKMVMFFAEVALILLFFAVVAYLKYGR